MAADEKQDGSVKQQKKSESKPKVDRFRYIGFDVFPTKNPKDLFKSDADRAKYVDRVVSKREKGDSIRDECTLFEERVSMSDRIILAIASLVIIATLFLPWYTAYNEIVEEQIVEEPVAAIADSLADSLGMMAGDSLSVAADSMGMMADSLGGAAGMTEGITDGGGTGAGQQANPNVTSFKNEAGEEVIHSFRARKKINKEHKTLAGFGTFTALGSVGAKLFSSGIVLMISTVLFILYALLSILLPIWTLYMLFGIKGSPDETALKLKGMLKFNWIPLILFVIAFILSFFGGQYGFDVASVELSSIGDSYGPGVFLGTMTFGIFISLAMFVLSAVKGVEI